MASVPDHCKGIDGRFDDFKYDGLNCKYRECKEDGEAFALDPNFPTAVALCGKDKLKTPELVKQDEKEVDNLLSEKKCDPEDGEQEDKDCDVLDEIKEKIETVLEKDGSSDDFSSEIDVQSVRDSIMEINNDDKNAFVLNLQSKFNTISGEITRPIFLKSMESLIGSHRGLPYYKPLSFVRKNGKAGSATLNNIYEELRKTPNGGKKTRRKKTKKTRTRKSSKVKRSKKRAKKQ
jgi:hypothetical protein